MTNKVAFLVKYYFQIPLKREVQLLTSRIRIKRVVKKILLKRDISRLSKAFTDEHSINIHILCSHLNLECLLLSLAAFYAFSREYAEIVLHEDGTFTKKDISLVKSIFPWIRYISLGNADLELKRKGFSDATIKLRRRHKLLIKAVDFHNIASKERILIIDTDLFFFKSAEELWRRIEEGKSFVFNRDTKPAYGASKEFLEKVIKKRIKIDLNPAVNTGLIVEPSRLLMKEKSIFEKYCEQIKHFPFPRIHCVEQGYIACLLKNMGIEEHPLSDKYKIVGFHNLPAVKKLKEYDFKNNPNNIETIHLCGWDKLGEDFRTVRKKLLSLIEKKI